VGQSQNQSKLGVKEVDNFMSENDTNKDGKISFEEF
jgi:Ca2+-binding EF-hand superfamily protein